MNKAPKLGPVLFALLALALVLAGCGGPKTQAPASGPKDVKSLRIGVIYQNLSHPYYQAHQKQTQVYAKQLGLQLVERDGKGDAAVVATAMDDLTTEKVDGIILALADAAAAVPSIKEAQRRGIPVVTFAIRHGAGAKAPFVGIDEGKATYEAGKEAAKRFHKTFGANAQANVLSVECPSVQAITDRADGFIKGFREADPKAKIVDRIDGHCTRERALKTSEDAIQAHPEVNVIYGANGDNALGALAALEGRGRGKVSDVFLVSHDASEPEIMKLVSPSSGLKLSVANLPKELARATIDTVIEVIQGKRPMAENTDVLVPAKVLTPDNLPALSAFLKDEYFSNLDLKKYAQK